MKYIKRETKYEEQKTRKCAFKRSKLTETRAYFDKQSLVAFKKSHNNNY